MYSKAQDEEKPDYSKVFQQKYEMRVILGLAIMPALSFCKGHVNHSIYNRTVVHPRRGQDKSIGERLVLTATGIANLERSSSNDKNMSSTTLKLTSSPTSFEVLCKLGSGISGNTYKVRKKDGKDKGCYFALKDQFAAQNVNPSSLFVHLKREFTLMKRSQSPFVPKVYYLFKDSKQSYFVAQLLIPFKRFLGLFSEISDI